MKVAATIVHCKQVGMDTWRDIKKTKVFDSSQSIDDMIAWAKRENPANTFHDIEFSEAVISEPDNEAPDA
jgi:hypothetical protein